MLLAGVAGVLGGTAISVDKTNDSTYLLISLIVVIVGGMGSLPGAAIGALLLGLIDSYGDVYLPVGYENYSPVLTFALLVLVLAVRPLGSSGDPDEPPRARAMALFAVVIVLGLLAPAVLTDFYLGRIFTQALWLGIAASSLIFLAAYGGWVSLGQIGLFGMAGFTMGNLVLADGGSKIAWNPWVAVIAAIVVTMLVGAVIGAISSRSEGIYFLMITLAFSVIVTLFFEKVTELSGFGGLNQVDRPGLPRHAPGPDAALLLRAGLLGRRLPADPLHRAHAVRHRVPGRARQLDPHARARLQRRAAPHRGVHVRRVHRRRWPASSRPGGTAPSRPARSSIDTTIDLLVIAVVGGLYRIEGAWIGAFVYAILDNTSRQIEFIGERFNTVIGLVFLLIVLISPGGLMGIYDLVSSRLRRPSGGAPPAGAGDGVAVGGTGT